MVYAHLPSATQGYDIKDASQTPRAHRVPSNPPASTIPPPNPYKPPTTPPPFLSHLPPTWLPYIQLTRLQKPSGLLAFYIPYLLGISYPLSTLSTLTPLSHTLAPAARLLLWCVLFRGMTCTWNDTIDSPFDRLVARTRQRPIARGAVSTTQAHVFTVIQAAACMAFLSLFPAPCVPDAALMTVLGFAYPFAKRVTHFPQVLLGFPFALGVPMACHALGLTPWSVERRVTTGWLCGVVVVWTVVYDTIYAHQDATDDTRAGVKSLAVLLGDGSKGALGGLAAVQVALLACAGWSMGVGWGFYVLSCGGTGVAMGMMLWRVDLRDPGSCGRWFGKQFWLVGGAMLGERVGICLARGL